MRWKDFRRSDNVDDSRGSGGGRGGVAIGGGLGTLVLVVVVYLLGGDPSQIVDSMQRGGGGAPREQRELTAEERETGDFSRAILGSTEDVWTAEFRKMGRTYEMPRMELFSDSVSSACGAASSQMGPFYCPADQKVYLDTTFFTEMEQRFHAAGDFARAYVIAHEVGHHVQNLLGISEQVQRRMQQVSKEEANQLSVRLELQADFLAGMWARKQQQKFDFLEKGDIEEALRAANAIGDDTLQKQAQGRVVPDSFTHGTSAQRVRWFKKGLESDTFDPNNTFSTRDL